MRPIYILPLLGGAVLCVAATYACGPEDCAVRRRCVQPEGDGGSGGGDGGSGGGFTDLGTPCAEPMDCESEQCVDGVCCASTCDGSCQSCKVAGQEGVCTPYDAATDPDTECGDGVCDGASGCASGDVVALTRYGGVDYSVVTAVVGGTGRTIVVGSFQGNIDFGVGVLSPSDAEDPFIVSFNQTTGAAEWHQVFEGEVGIGDVAMDSVGNVFVVGAVTVGAKIGGVVQMSAGPSMTKLSPTGSVQWTKVFESQGAAYIVATTADLVDGGMFVAGEFAGDINLGGGWLNGLLGRLFIAKLDSDGEYVWGKNPGPATILSTPQFGQQIAMASSTLGTVAVSSAFSGDIDVGGGQWSSDQGEDFVMVMDALGGHIWSLQMPALVHAVAFDSLGGLYVTGVFGTTMDLGGGPLVSSGSATLFAAAFDAQGSHRWSKAFTASGNEVTAVDVDGNGNMLLSIKLGGSMIVGGEMFNSDIDDALIVKLAGSTGEPLWAEKFGDAGEPESQIPRGVVASGDDVIVVGDFLNIMQAGTFMATANGDEDVFVVRLTP